MIQWLLLAFAFALGLYGSPSDATERGNDCSMIDHGISELKRKPPPIDHPDLNASRLIDVAGQ